MLHRRFSNLIFRGYFTLFLKQKFKSFGNLSFIINPIKLTGLENISINENVIIAYGAWLSASNDSGEASAELIIGKGTRIGHFSHIYSTKSIVIGDAVLISDKVYISDNLHNYDDVTIAILDQSIKQLSQVVIGDGAWIGENVCIIGAKVGRNSVIGANSVVTKDIPDYCVAVGVPAKVIKKYNQITKIWEKT